MKLIWHYDPAGLLENDWLHYLLGETIDEEIVDIGLTRYDDDSIHLISNLRGPLSMYQSYFQECRSRCRHIALLHVSDEYFAGGYKVYQYFDLVIRINHTYLAAGDGILTIPWGYPNGTGSCDRPADQRRYAWSFVGEFKSSRGAMAKAFDGFQPQYFTWTDSLYAKAPKRLSQPEFNAIIEDTVFAPCPMGNATIDTNRIYERLEFGCIPLIELRQTLDFYTNLLGNHPLPAFRTWVEARRFAEATFNDKAALLRLQADIITWWASYKAKLRAEIRTELTGKSHAQELREFAEKLRNRVTVVHAPLRIIEILRHQSMASLVWRLSKPTGPIKRIVTDIVGHGRS